MHKWGAALLAASTVASARDLRPVGHARRDASSLMTNLHPVQYPTGSAQVKRQANPFTPDHELDMEYADMNTYNDPEKETFGATVHIGTKDPAVQTEQFGNEVTNIQCTGNSMVIDFENADVAKQAQSAWNVPALTIITKTDGCNEDDERVPWSLSNFRFADNKATADAKKLSWDDASVSMSVDFGGRGNVTNPDAPAPGTQKRDNTADKQDLGFALQNLVLFTQSTGGLTQSCKDCHGKGTATLKTGKFNVKNVASEAAGAAKTEAAHAATVVSQKVVAPVETAASKAADTVKSAANSVESKASQFLHGIFRREEDDNGLEKRSAWSEIADHFTDATIDLSLDGFAASFLFESKLDSHQQFNFHIAGKDGWGLPGLSIKDIVTVGPSIDPVLVVSADLAEPITFDYGFEFSMPDGAGLSLNFLDPTKSSIDKIDKTTFKALPFTTNADTVASKGFNVSVAFRPVISLGVKFLKETIDPIELTLDVPKFNAHVEYDQKVDKNCKAGGDTNALKFQGDFAFGVGADTNIKIVDAIDFNPSAKLFSTSGLFPVSTCFPLTGVAAKTTPAATASATASATGAKSASTKPSGVQARGNLFASAASFINAEKTGNVVAAVSSRIQGVATKANGAAAVATSLLAAAETHVVGGNLAGAATSVLAAAETRIAGGNIAGAATSLLAAAETHIPGGIPAGAVAAGTSLLAAAESHVAGGIPSGAVAAGTSLLAAAESHIPGGIPAGAVAAGTSLLAAAETRVAGGIPSGAVAAGTSLLAAAESHVAGGNLAGAASSLLAGGIPTGIAAHLQKRVQYTGPPAANNKPDTTCTDEHKPAPTAPAASSKPAGNPPNGGIYGQAPGASSAPAPPPQPASSTSTSTTPAAASKPAQTPAVGGSYGQAPAVSSAPAPPPKPASSSTTPVATSKPVETPAIGGSYGQAPGANSAPAPPPQPASSSTSTKPAAASKPAQTPAVGGSYGQAPAVSSAPAPPPQPASSSTTPVATTKPAQTSAGASQPPNVSSPPPPPQSKPTDAPGAGRCSYSVGGKDAVNQGLDDKDNQGCVYEGGHLENKPLKARKRSHPREF